MPRSSSPAASWFFEKTRTARCRDGADVDQQLDPGILKLVQYCLGRRLFIADGEELFRFARHIRVQLFAMSSVEGYVSPGTISITGQVMAEESGAALPPPALCRIVGAEKSCCDGRSRGEIRWFDFAA